MNCNTYEYNPKSNPKYTKKLKNIVIICDETKASPIITLLALVMVRLNLKINSSIIGYMTPTDNPIFKMFCIEAFVSKDDDIAWLVLLINSRSLKIRIGIDKINWVKNSNRNNLKKRKILTELLSGITPLNEKK